MIEIIPFAEQTKDGNHWVPPIGLRDTLHPARAPRILACWIQQECINLRLCLEHLYLCRSELGFKGTIAGLRSCRTGSQL
jgi:hypothetical protein